MSVSRDKNINDVKHVINTGHNIDFENTLHRCENYLKRLIREAKEIEKGPNNLNSRDGTPRLPHTCKHILANFLIKPKITIQLTQLGKNLEKE